MGSAIATNPARNGAKVVLAARDARKEVVNHLRKSGHEGMVYPGLGNCAALLGLQDAKRET
jgi:hypothetical protein